MKNESNIDLNSFGIIGTGSIFPYFVFALNNANLNLKAICGLNKQDLSQDILTKYDFYDNYLDLIKRHDIRNIIIATPPSLHYEMVMSALKAGKNVLCEKPLCTNMKQVKSILDYCIKNKNKSKLYIGYHSKFQPINVKSKELVLELMKDNELKEVEIKYSEYVLNYHPKSSWIFQKEISGGGCIIDSGINAISVVSDTLGPLSVNNVKLAYHNEFNSVETQAEVVLKTINNVKVRLNMDWLNNQNEERSFTFKFENNLQLNYNFVTSTVVVSKNNKEIYSCYQPISTNTEVKTSMYEEYMGLVKDYIEFCKSNETVNTKGIDPILSVFEIYSKGTNKLVN